jgi:hypothetical protein
MLLNTSLRKAQNRLVPVLLIVGSSKTLLPQTIDRIKTLPQQMIDCRKTSLASRPRCFEFIHRTSSACSRSLMTIMPELLVLYDLPDFV